MNWLNLTARVMVGILGIPLIALCAVLGGIPFLLLIFVISTAGLVEFYFLASHQNYSPSTIPGVILGAAVPLIAYTGPEFLGMHLIASMIILLIIELFKRKQNALVNVSASIAGVLYLSFLSMLILIREHAFRSDPSYRFAGSVVLLLFVCIWACDTVAYFVGSFLGRHPLFPRVSPKKSWEGAAAGFIGAVGAALIFHKFCLPSLEWYHAIFWGLCVGILGQIGDLAESLLKRDSAVKDTSRILPGHGGILDRFDSMLFVAPAVYLYILIFHL